MRRLGIGAEHLRLGYTRHWDRFDPAARREVDIAFLGCSSARRDRILAGYAPGWAGRRVALVISDNRPTADTSPDFVVGEDKRRLLAGSKLVLNLHRGSEPYFEWLRALEAIHCGSVLISEWSSDHAPLVAGEHFVSGRPEVLNELAEEMIEDEARRLEIAGHAYELIRSRLPMRTAAEALAERATALAGRQPSRRAGRRAATGGRGNRSTGAGVVALVELGLRPVTKFAGQMKEIRTELAEVSRRLDELDFRLAEGRAPEPRVEHETAAFAGRSGSPQVSVCVSVHDYAHVVVDALRSVAESELADFELVVVDDDSRDRSAEVVRGWMEGVPDLPAVLVRQPVNRGLAAARNTAVERSRGEYVLILDADNQIYPHCLSRLAAALDADPDAGFAYGLLQRFDETGPTGLLGKFGWNLERLRRGNYIDALAMIRRTALDEVGGFSTDPRLMGWEDYDLWCAIASRGMHGAHVREILGRYRVATESMTRTMNLSLDGTQRLIAERYPLLFRGSTPLTWASERLAEILNLGEPRASAPQRLQQPRDHLPRKGPLQAQEDARRPAPQRPQRRGQAPRDRGA
jgi:hypothetical protein